MAAAGRRCVCIWGAAVGDADCQQSLGGAAPCPHHLFGWGAKTDPSPPRRPPPSPPVLIDAVPGSQPRGPALLQKRRRHTVSLCASHSGG